MERLFAEYKGQLSKEEIQELWVEVIDSCNVYSSISGIQSFFEQTFKLTKDLNFHVKDHWAPSFLALVALRIPKTPVLHFFIKNGADLNFVFDELYFIEEKG